MLFPFLTLSTTLLIFFGCCFFKAIKDKNDVFAATEKSFSYQHFLTDVCYSECNQGLILSLWILCWITKQSLLLSELVWAARLPSLHRHFLLLQCLWLPQRISQSWLSGLLLSSMCPIALGMHRYSSSLTEMINLLIWLHSKFSLTDCTTMPLSWPTQSFLQIYVFIIATSSHKVGRF